MHVWMLTSEYAAVLWHHCSRDGDQGPGAPWTSGSEGAPNGCQMFLPRFPATYHGTPNIKPRHADTPSPPPPRPVSRRCLHHTRVATSSSSSNNSIYQIITATAAECQGELKPVETASFANSRSKVQTSHSSLKGAQASEF